MFRASGLILFSRRPTQTDTDNHRQLLKIPAERGSIPLAGIEQVRTDLKGTINEFIVSLKSVSLQF